VPTCFVVHGWSETNGKNPYAFLDTHIEKRGWDVEAFLWNINMAAPHPHYICNQGKRLANLASKGDIVIAVSAGASIAYEALTRHRAPFSQVILISPNLKRSAGFPENNILKGIHVWYSPEDKVLAKARQGSISISALTFFVFGRHPWGRMGIFGGTEEHLADSRFHQTNTMDYGVSRHVGTLEKQHLHIFLPQILAAIPDLC